MGRVYYLEVQESGDKKEIEKLTFKISDDAELVAFINICLNNDYELKIVNQNYHIKSIDTKKIFTQYK